MICFFVAFLQIPLSEALSVPALGRSLTLARRSRLQGPEIRPRVHARLGALHARVRRPAGARQSCVARAHTHHPVADTRGTDLKHIMSAERLPFSLTYFGSLGATLYFAIGVRRWELVDWVKSELTVCPLQTRPPPSLLDTPLCPTRRFPRPLATLATRRAARHSPNPPSSPSSQRSSRSARCSSTSGHTFREGSRRSGSVDRWVSADEGVGVRGSGGVMRRCNKRDGRVRCRALGTGHAVCAGACGRAEKKQRISCVRGCRAK